LGLSEGEESSSGSSHGDSERGGSIVPEVAVVSFLDNTVVTSVASEVFVAGEVSLDEVHHTLRDRHGVLKNSPSDTFPARRGSEGAIVSKEFSGVEAFHEGLEWDSLSSLSPPGSGAFSRAFFSSRNFVQFHGVKERVGLLQFSLTVKDFLASVVLAVSLSEHNSEHSVVNLVVEVSVLGLLALFEAAVVLGSVVIGEHDEMHLKVVILVINGVLRRLVHVELVRLVVKSHVIALFSLELDGTFVIELGHSGDLSEGLLYRGGGLGLGLRLFLQSSANFILGMALSLEVESTVGVLTRLASNVGSSTF